MKLTPAELLAADCDEAIKTLSEVQSSLRRGVSYLRSQPPPPAPKAEGGEVSDEELRMLSLVALSKTQPGLTELDRQTAIRRECWHAGRASLAAELEAVRLEMSQERATHLDTVKKMRDAGRAELAEKDRRIAELEGQLENVSSIPTDTNRKIMYTYEYPRPAVTCDVVLFGAFSTGAKVLCITRGAEPFLGKLALPGGHRNPGEPSVECAQRELFEETGVQIPLEDLILFGVYDKKDRDPRGDYVSHAYFATAPYNPESIGIKAGDDASSAQWVSLREIQRETLAFDHYDMIVSAAGCICGVRL